MPDHILLQLGERGSFSMPLGNRVTNTWASSDEGVAIVYANGTVRATGPGMATITAGNGQYTAYGVVFVRDYAPSLVRSLTLDNLSLTMDVGQNARLNARTASAYARNHTVYYISSDSSIARVDEGGKVTAISNGEATIYAYSADWSSWAGCNIYVGQAGITAQQPQRQPGWYFEKGIWVYYAVGGAAPTTGWLQLDEGTYHFDEYGGMQTGWQQIDGQQYYLDQSGQLQRGWLQLVDGLYYLGDDGIMQTGWLLQDGKWYRLDDKGRAYTGWHSDGNSYRYYRTDGSMATGWIEINEAWYYLDASGIMQRGWLKYGGEWFYLREDGVMQVSWQDIDGETYFFRPNGSMYTGWYYDWQHWYYLHESGKKIGTLALEWNKIEGEWYYMHPGGNLKGRMATRWNIIDGQRYYFRYSGAMVTGWLYDGAEWYYFDDAGRFKYKTSQPVM